MKFKFKHSKLNFEAKKNSSNGINIHLLFDDEVGVSYQSMSGIDPANIIADITSAGSYLIHGSDVLFSLGSKTKFNLITWLSIGNAIAKFINISKMQTINLFPNNYVYDAISLSEDVALERFLVELGNGLYYFDDFKSEKNKFSLENIVVITDKNLKKVFANVVAILEGYFVVRDLANNPSNIATPSYLASVAEGFAKISDKVNVEILGKKDLQKLGMNAFLGVAKGSIEEPKFIKLHYNGGKKSAKPVVLVGKGITFDSGGISLKPGANMDDMKYDMCGAATVLGTFAAIARLGVAINLVVLVATCENMPSGNAQKPGDIVTSMAGKTIEILNTDAEGRLILCDALHYAKQYNPEWVIDVATLTGACVIALGSVASGLYVNNEELHQSIQTASTATNEKVWRMPLFDEYKALLKGTHADLLNIGGWGGKGGSVTAACFLQEFIDYNWAHLDIAGVANSAEAKGGTGRPFKLLVELIRNESEK